MKNYSLLLTLACVLCSPTYSAASSPKNEIKKPKAQLILVEKEVLPLDPNEPKVKLIMQVTYPDGHVSIEPVPPRHLSTKQLTSSNKYCAFIARHTQKTHGSEYVSYHKDGRTTRYYPDGTLSIHELIFVPNTQAAQDCE